MEFCFIDYICNKREVVRVVGLYYYYWSVDDELVLKEKSFDWSYMEARLKGVFLIDIKKLVNVFYVLKLIIRNILLFSDVNIIFR